MALRSAARLITVIWAGVGLRNGYTRYFSETPFPSQSITYSPSLPSHTIHQAPTPTYTRYVAAEDVPPLILSWIPHPTCPVQLSAQTPSSVLSAPSPWKEELVWALDSLWKWSILWDAGIRIGTAIPVVQILVFASEMIYWSLVFTFTALLSRVSSPF